MLQMGYENQSFSYGVFDGFSPVQVERETFDGLASRSSSDQVSSLMMIAQAVPYPAMVRD